MPVSCPVTRIGWHLQLRTSEWQLKVWGVDGTLSSLTPIGIGVGEEAAQIGRQRKHQESRKI